MWKKLFISCVVAMALLASAAPGTAQYRYRVGSGGVYYGRGYYPPRVARPYYGGYPGGIYRAPGYGVYTYPTAPYYAPYNNGYGVGVGTGYGLGYGYGPYFY